MIETQTGELVERLQRAREAAQTLGTLQAEAAEVGALEAELRERAAAAEAADRLQRVFAQAQSVVGEVRPDLENWRLAYEAWLRQGLDLLQRQKAIQGRLLPSLDLTVAAAASLAHVGFVPGPDAWGTLPLVTDAAVDRILSQLGVGDLDPFPPSEGQGFVNDVTNAFVPHVGRLFRPSLGRVQFKRGQASARRRFGG